MDNQFGKTSRLHIIAEPKDNRTILKDVSFTAPFKIMTPFQKENGGIQIMPLCASAGIMRGDHQEFSYLVRTGADLEILSQSFDKIHKMDGGQATRNICAVVEKNASLYYYPQPVIPFAGSAFDSKMEISLEDISSRFFMVEILSCGRIAHQEQFAYRRFSSRVEIRRNNALIYRDNTLYEPDKMPMSGLGMYEGYTHMANVFLSTSGNAKTQSNLQTQIWELLEQAEGDTNGSITGGITSLAEGDLAIRLLGSSAQELQNICEQVKKLYQSIL